MKHSRLVPADRVQVPHIQVDTEISGGGFAFTNWWGARYSAVNYRPVPGYPGGKGNIILSARAAFRGYLFFDLPKIASMMKLSLRRVGRGHFRAAQGPGRFKANGPELT